MTASGPSGRRADRRRFLHALAAGGTASVLAVKSAAEAAEDSFPWMVGVGTADITPPLEVGLLMSSGRRLWAPFEGVRLPLLARAVVVQKTDRRLALVALDLLGLAGQAVGGMESFKRRVAAAAEDVIRPDQLLLASSHTHTAPESIALTDLDRTTAFQNWIAQLANKIGEAVRIAAGGLRPCRLTAGSCLAPGFSVNRRIKTTRGIASVRTKLSAESLIGPEGPNDDAVRIAAFVGRAGRPEAILVNFTAHPVLEMCIPQVSPDYPGELCRELERRRPGTTVLFLQGASGNINPPTMERSAENCRRYGRRLAELADGAIDNLQPVAGDALALEWKTVTLPARTVTGKPEPRALRARIAAARIGNAALVMLPGEPFVEIAAAIRRASPWPFTAVVGYADEYIGYIPTDEAFRNGGYEIGPGAWSRVAAGSEPIVRQAAIDLL